MTSEQIEYMVQRFLGWHLPENFNPDDGISFKRDYTAAGHPMKHEPTGTNLFDYGQAKEMIRYLVDGMPVASAPSPEELAREILTQLIIAGIRLAIMRWDVGRPSQWLITPSISVPAPTQYSWRKARSPNRK